LLERAATWTQAALIGAIIALAWLPYVSAPLLLDETGTWWAISAGASHVWTRFYASGQSILYGYLVCAFSWLTGSTAEWVLRLPSILASIGTLLALYRLGQAALGSPHRFLLPLYWLLFLHPPGLDVLLSPPSIVLQARPYAMAMCAGAWALHAMHGFVATGRRRQLWAFALLTGVTPWFSFFFLLPLAACALPVLVLTLQKKSIPLVTCAGVFGLWAAMTAPLLPQILTVARSAGLHAIPYVSQGRLDPAAVWAPPAIAIGVLAALAASRARSEPVRLSPTLTLLALIISFVSVAPLFAATRLTGTNVAAVRYMCLAFAPLALLYGTVLVRYASASAQITALLLTVALVQGPELLSHRSPEQELAHSYPRIIAEIERERSASLGRAKVYLTGSFVEASRERFPAAESRNELIAPFLYYKLSEPYRLLPNRLAQSDPEWAAELVAQLQSDPIFIFAGSAFPAWLRDATRESHSIRVVTQSRSYVIAVLRKK
jgi:hypothetical protein